MKTKTKTKKRYISSTLLGLAFISLILFLPFQVLLFTQSYYSYLQDLSAIDIPETNATEYNQQIISYFLYQHSSIEFLNEKEMSHMVDVRDIFLAVHLITLLSGFILLIYWQRLTRSHLTNFSVFGIFNFIVVLILAKFTFPLMFNTFHELTFSPGTWQFSPDSILIRLLPFNFFRLFFLHSLSISFIILLLVFLATWLQKPSRKAPQTSLYQQEPG